MKKLTYKQMKQVVSQERYEITESGREVLNLDDQEPMVTYLVSRENGTEGVSIL